jgi:hypothetical protein
MKDQTHASRPSLPGALGMQCAWLSLASGAVSVIVAFLLWWQNVTPDLARVGQQAGIFSAALGLTLASVGAASQRKRVRRVAAGGVVVNLFILALVLDSIFSILR